MTFLEMQTKLGTLLNDPSNQTWALALLKEVLNDAVEDLLLELYELGEFRMKSTSITTTGGVRYKDLPSDFLYARRIFKEAEYDLDITERRAVFSDYRGEPVACWIEGVYQKIGGVESFAQVMFEPMPDGAYPYTLDYFPVYVAMSQDGDVNPLPAPFHKLAVYDAAIRLEIAKGRLEIAKGLTVIRNTLYESLLEKNTSRWRGQSVGGFRNVYGGG